MATVTQPTRERILLAARRLFAEQGYKGTSVGEIEAAAGLSPRAGALYKHSPSKQAVLAAVIAQHTDVVQEMSDRLELMPPGDLRAELMMTARWGLAELRREHELTRIVMKEGERFPEIAEAFREAIVMRGHRIAADGSPATSSARAATSTTPTRSPPSPPTRSSATRSRRCCSGPRRPAWTRSASWPRGSREPTPRCAA